MAYTGLFNRDYKCTLAGVAYNRLWMKTLLSACAGGLER